MTSTTHKYVIDANILFSAFISGKEVYTLLFSEYTIYLPDFAFLELEKYKQRIIKKTKLTEHEFQEFVLRLLKDVTVIPNLLLSQASLTKAYELCQEIDEKDTVYIAAALELNLALVTSDKRLYTHLKTRDFSQIMLLGDVINTLPQFQGETS
ncbi:MAG TPA: PIN domain-containing protein [Deltaproteobacteria bacterium]|nr:MAG: DNA-binding protein [Deltaproteobacteria bacterium]HDM75224.1 PIN domain-containing protein [Deltaproteobacteria bacterium]